MHELFLLLHNIQTQTYFSLTLNTGLKQHLDLFIFLLLLLLLLKIMYLLLFVFCM